MYEHVERFKIARNPQQLGASLPKEKFEPTPNEHEDRGLFERVKDIFG